MKQNGGYGSLLAGRCPENKISYITAVTKQKPWTGRNRSTRLLAEVIYLTQYYSILPYKRVHSVPVTSSTYEALDVSVGVHKNGLFSIITRALSTLSDFQNIVTNFMNLCLKKIYIYMYMSLHPYKHSGVLPFIKSQKDIL